MSRPKTENNANNQSQKKKNPKQKRQNSSKPIYSYTQHENQTAKPLRCLILNNDSQAFKKIREGLENLESQNHIQIGAIVQDKDYLNDLLVQNGYQVIILLLKDQQQAQEFPLQYTRHHLLILISSDISLAAHGYEWGAVYFLLADQFHDKINQALVRVSHYLEHNFYPANQSQKKHEHKKDTQELQEYWIKLYKLTRKEAKICFLLRQGKSRHQVKNTLAIKDGTLRFHLNNIYEKLLMPQGINPQGENKFAFLINFLTKKIKMP